MKTIFILTFIVLSLFSKEKINLNYWTPFTGGDARPMQFIIDKFNKSQTNITVTMKVLEWGDVYYNTLSSSIGTKNSPDISIVHGSKIAEFVSGDKLIPIDEIMIPEKIKWDNFTDISLSNAKYKNKYYGIPIDNYVLMMFYNKKYLKSSGVLDKNGKLQIKNGGDNLIELFINIKKNLQEDVVVLGQPIDNVFPFWIWFTLYFQTGNHAYIENNQVSFNNKDGLKALEFLVKLRDSKIYSKYINDTQGYNMFKYQKSAIFITGPWATWSFEQIDDLDFGVTEFPLVFSKRSLWSDSHTLAIPKGISDVKQKAALKFANFVASSGLDWSIAGHIPSSKKVLNSKEYKSKPIRSQYANYIQYAYSMDKHPKLWKCNNKMVEILSSMMQSKLGAKETLQLASQEINKILKEK